ncbi:hypothetical protein [Mucilaginibacter sp. 3215]|uniref:hypothetical protein n=1 Tax=Mucilaginibacter sp. 3215 TaxID=3373912 RepID=UPI003D1E683B
MLRYWPFKKVYLLVLGTVLLAAAGYGLAFKHTLHAKSLNKQLREQLAQQNNATEQPGYTDRKNANLDRIISLYRADTLTYRSSAINTIAFLAEKNNVKFVSAPLQDKNYHTEKYILQKLTFSGDYFSLLKLLNQLQQANGTGRIRSCSLRAPTRNEGTSDSRIILLDVLFEVIVK